MRAKFLESISFPLDIWEIVLIPKLHSESIVFKLIFLDFAVDFMRVAISCELYMNVSSIFVQNDEITKLRENRLKITKLRDIL